MEYCCTRYPETGAFGAEPREKSNLVSRLRDTHYSSQRSPHPHARTHETPSSATPNGETVSQRALKCATLSAAVCPRAAQHMNRRQPNTSHFDRNPLRRRQPRLPVMARGAQLRAPIPKCGPISACEKVDRGGGRLGNWDRLGAQAATSTLLILYAAAILPISTSSRFGSI
jgi:hypothetical protein